MDENKEKEELNDELLEQVSGGNVFTDPPTEEAAGLGVKKCMFYSPIIRFKPVIQYKHHLFREVFIMDKNSEKEKLNDELLNKVSGGCGEVDVILVGELTCPNCEGNPALYLMSTDDSGRFGLFGCTSCPYTEEIYL